MIMWTVIGWVLLIRDRSSRRGERWRSSGGAAARATFRRYCSMTAGFRSRSATSSSPMSRCAAARRTGSCSAAGLVDAAGRPTVTAYRFRHTVGTQLAERGAKLRTIMSVLGHESPHMSMIYARISDAEVLRDYRSVLEPGVMIAGAGAEAIRSGLLDAPAIYWLRSNFLKTELELGHCLRFPSESPSECDLYLSCSRFVTTPAYAPRLRERRDLELTLADDARERAWPREVERHCGIARRGLGAVRG